MRGAHLVTNIVHRTDGAKPPRLVLADHLDGGIDRPSRSPTAFHSTFNAPDVDFRFGVRSSDEQIRNGSHLARQVRLGIGGRDPLGQRATDNFLLPGNIEDGADKSRHWNVFGAICLYKSPQEALDLALKREMSDLREGHFAEAEMREFLRDMIGDLNGMFHVMTVNPALLDTTASPGKTNP